MAQTWTQKQIAGLTGSAKGLYDELIKQGVRPADALNTARATYGATEAPTAKSLAAAINTAKENISNIQPVLQRAATATAEASKITGVPVDTKTPPEILTPEQIQQKIREGIATGIEEFKKQYMEDIAAQKRENVTTALDDFRAMLAGSGLESLADTLDKMIREDKTAAQIKLEIRNTEAYKQRFPGMAALSTKKRAISEGDYIALERGYEQILRSYGLDTTIYGDREDLGKYIANEVSAKEFEDRVSLAKTRVEQQPEVTQALSDIYGINKQDAVGYLLNPEKAMDIINKQVRASEIGAAALAAKFELGDTAAAKAAQAEAFIGAAGSTDFTSLKQTFGRARVLADTQKRLAYLERTGYNDIEAVQAELEQNTGAILASQKRAAREQARFGGSTGISAASLRKESSI